jgi:hypothetical protein
MDSRGLDIDEIDRVFRRRPDGALAELRTEGPDAFDLGGLGHGRLSGSAPPVAALDL